MSRIANKESSNHIEYNNCIREVTVGSLGAEILGDSSNPVKGEISLWRAVITQALMDAGSSSQTSEMKFERAKAISWLSGVSPDFYTVCSLADLEPDYIKEKSKEAISRKCTWRVKSNKKKKCTKIKTTQIEPIITEVINKKFNII